MSLIFSFSTTNRGIKVVARLYVASVCRIPGSRQNTSLNASRYWLTMDVDACCSYLLVAA
jgi:hypothetical protein